LRVPPYRAAHRQSARHRAIDRLDVAEQRINNKRAHCAGLLFDQLSKIQPDPSFSIWCAKAHPMKIVWET
jgi:hypothetical protein